MSDDTWRMTGTRLADTGAFPPERLHQPVAPLVRSADAEGVVERSMF